MMYVDLREGRDAPRVSTASAAQQEALQIKGQCKREPEQGNPEGIGREKRGKKWFYKHEILTKHCSITSATELFPNV